MESAQHPEVKDRLEKLIKLLLKHRIYLQKYYINFILFIVLTTEQRITLYFCFL